MENHFPVFLEKRMSGSALPEAIAISKRQDLYQFDFQTATIRPTTKHTKEHEGTRTAASWVRSGYASGVLFHALCDLRGFFARLTANWYYAVDIQTGRLIRWKPDSPAAAWYAFYLFHKNFTQV
jgi:hypothetical protein